MKYLASHENEVRGTFDFPMELYHVDRNHPRYEMPFHWHMEHELILIEEGALTLSVEGETFRMEKGDCALISDGAIHGGVPENCVYGCLVFDLERFLAGSTTCGQRIRRLIDSGARLEGNFPAGTPAAEMISRMVWAMETQEPGYEFTIVGLSWQLWGELLTHKLYTPADEGSTKDVRRTKAVKNVLRRIRSDYGKPLGLEDLAAEAAMEPKYFCRVFRQITGRTPVNYLNYYRVECAAELLCSTSRSVTEIAMECGFEDAGYFSRIFRQFKEETPRHYRQTHEADG